MLTVCVLLLSLMPAFVLAADVDVKQYLAKDANTYVTLKGSKYFTNHTTKEPNSAKEAVKKIDKDVFVNAITQVSLKKADQATAEFVCGQIKALLYEASYRPQVFGGKTDTIKQWPIQNDDYDSDHPVKKVTDKGLGTTVSWTPYCAGCLSYGRFCSEYVYGTSGDSRTYYTKKVDGVDSKKELLTADALRKKLLDYADPGETLYYKTNKNKVPHALVFLGESTDGKGFYFLSYDGGLTDGKEYHNINVGYFSYNKFHEVVYSILIYDTNSGSYHRGNAFVAFESKKNAPCGAVSTKTTVADRLENEQTDATHSHVWDEGTVSEGATCQAEGIKTYRCTVEGCDETKTEVIPVKSHIPDGNMDCAKDTVCGLCGLVLKQGGAHTWGQGLVTKAPTDTAEGEITYVCMMRGCGAEKTERIPKVESESDPEDEEETEKIRFTDVPSDAYYAAAVAWAVRSEIGAGTSATAFSPEWSCTRGQAVMFLWRAAGSPMPTDRENPYEDVASDAYYYSAVLWAVEKGITSGTSAHTFSPHATCTRGQIMTFLWRTQNSPVADVENPFDDVSEESYYRSAVLWAVKSGITSGTSATSFSPEADCTRGQIVTFLYRCMNQ